MSNGLKPCPITDDWRVADMVNKTIRDCPNRRPAARDGEAIRLVRRACDECVDDGWEYMARKFLKSLPVPSDTPGSYTIGSGKDYSYEPSNPEPDDIDLGPDVPYEIKPAPPEFGEGGV